MRTRVVFNPQRGVVVNLGIGNPAELPLGGRNFLNSSFPGPSMKELEADIMTRQYGQMTLLRDQKRGVDRQPYPNPVNYQRGDYAEIPVMNRPYIGIVDMEEV